MTRQKYCSIKSHTPGVASNRCLLEKGSWWPTAGPWNANAASLIGIATAFLGLFIGRSMLGITEYQCLLSPDTSRSSLENYCPRLNETRTCPLQIAGDHRFRPKLKCNSDLTESTDVKKSRECLIAYRDALACYMRQHQGRVLKRFSAPDCTPRVVTTVCRKGMLCGGLGDRVRGLVIGAFQAILTESLFVHEIIKPVPLDLFFQNMVVSSRRRDSVLNCRNRIGPVPWISIDGNELAAFNYSQEWDNIRYIDVITNAAPHRCIWGNPSLTAKLKALGLQDIPYSVAASAVLKLYHGTPTPTLQAAQAKLVANCLPDKLVFRIGVHIRTGADPSFHDPPRHRLDVATQFAAKAAELCSLQPLECSIFVTSDHCSGPSIFERKLARIYGLPISRLQEFDANVLQFENGTRRVKMIYLAGNAFHLDKMTAHDIRTVEKTYLEWHFLAYYTDFLLASSSGFSVAAIHANLVPHLMYADGKGFVSPLECNSHHCRQVRGEY
jgi:hypothetical protein